MSDRLFFPLVFLIALTMVAVAAWRPPGPCPTGSVSVSNTNYGVIDVANKQLNRFLTKGYVEKQTCEADGDYVLKLTTPADTVYPSSPELGPHFRLAPDIETALSGRKTKLLVEARGVTNGAAFELTYHTGPDDGSSWQRYELSDEFEQLVFDYEVPERRQEQGVDYLAIRPVSTEAVQDIEIRRITFLTPSLIKPADRKRILAELGNP